MAQSEKVRRKIAQTLVWLQTLDRLPTSILKSIEGKKGLFEIRVEFGGDIFRIFCCFDEGSLVILFNGFQKKTQKTPSNEIEKADRELEKLKKEKEAKKGNGKKNILQTLLAYELHRGEVEEVLIKFGWVRKDAYFMESELYCWLEREPSDEDIKKVLTEIGYDVSKL